MSIPREQDHLNVLAIAYACNPSAGSEAGVGWGWVNAIAARHRITVITADYNAGDIERNLENRRDDASRNLRFVYVKNRAWHYRPQGTWLKIENSFAKPLMNLAYQHWLGCACADARHESQKERYDLVHLITYVGWRFPGKFYQLGIPFVWGPIGGMKNTPWRLLPVLGLKGAIYYGGRNLVNSLQIAILPGPRRALRRAQGAAIAATTEIQQSLFEHFGVPSRVICEIGSPEVGPVEPRTRNSDEPLGICWSGLHLPGKALHLLLRAAARLPHDTNYRIDILGDGPCNQEWRSLARRLGVDSQCVWHGQVPRMKALEVMKSTHVFVLTSLKELTATVAVEAASLALPIICLDHCGLADLVTEDCGIKVHPGSASQIVRDLADAINTLFRDETLRRCLSAGAIARSRDYSWQGKTLSIDEIYSVAMQSLKPSTAGAVDEATAQNLLRDLDRTHTSCLQVNREREH